MPHGSVSEQSSHPSRHRNAQTTSQKPGMGPYRVTTRSALVAKQIMQQHSTRATRSGPIRTGEERLHPRVREIIAFQHPAKLRISCDIFLPHILQFCAAFRDDIVFWHTCYLDSFPAPPSALACCPSGSRFLVHGDLHLSPSIRF